MHQHIEIWSFYICVYTFIKYCVHLLKNKLSETLFEFSDSNPLEISLFYTGVSLFDFFSIKRKILILYWKIFIFTLFSRI